MKEKSIDRRVLSRTMYKGPYKRFFVKNEYDSIHRAISIPDCETHRGTLASLGFDLLSVHAAVSKKVLHRYVVKCVTDTQMLSVLLLAFLSETESCTFLCTAVKTHKQFRNKAAHGKYLGFRDLIEIGQGLYVIFDFLQREIRQKEAFSLFFAALKRYSQFATFISDLKLKTHVTSPAAKPTAVKLLLSVVEGLQELTVEKIPPEVENPQPSEEEVEKTLSSSSSSSSPSSSIIEIEEEVEEIIPPQEPERSVVPQEESALPEVVFSSSRVVVQRSASRSPPVVVQRPSSSPQQIVEPTSSTPLPDISRRQESEKQRPKQEKSLRQEKTKQVSPTPISVQRAPISVQVPPGILPTPFSLSDPSPISSLEREKHLLMRELEIQRRLFAQEQAIRYHPAAPPPHPFTPPHVSNFVQHQPPPYPCAPPPPDNKRAITVDDFRVATNRCKRIISVHPHFPGYEPHKAQIFENKPFLASFIDTISHDPMFGHYFLHQEIINIRTMKERYGRHASRFFIFSVEDGESAQKMATISRWNGSNTLVLMHDGNKVNLSLKKRKIIITHIYSIEGFLEGIIKDREDPDSKPGFLIPLDA